MMDAHLPSQSHLHDAAFEGRGVTAVLGPTNTGKTFLAIERMVAHSSGVIGLPLRLLAREVYQRVVERVGPGAVSLITGEEKIKPPNARYSVCTVEAMPRDPGTAFVAIDEVQLAADLERGHVFTDRILHTRGREETLLLGAGTMRGVLEQLLKGLSVVTRPRMSNLFYDGARKITRLPRRTAIVAFSAEEVYAIAELIRRQRGGAAVVLGALSPRTRNAQVELYQAGEVDFLVATDAIGMGLNLDLDHVAFAQDWKYDGFQYRRLAPAELGQIAGRAGRHVRDGTFGVTGQVDPFEPEIVEALEAHAFQPVRTVQWRSRDLDFGSIDRLKASLDRVPPVGALTRALPAVDQRALEFLSRDRDVVERATDARRVELLWEACKLPDYRRIAPAQHAEIIASIYADLVAHGHVSEEYMAAQVRRADRTEGDIDTLSQRIAEIRTWTYISHRPGWLADPTHWQENTRSIEDRLSDALHDRLTKRFVDRRTSVLMKRLRENALMEAEIAGDGSVMVEGHHVGELQGFRFTPDSKADGQDAKAVRAAAQKALAGEFDTRAERFANAPNGDLALGSDGLLRWLGAPIAALTSGEDPLKPRAVLFADEQLTGPSRDKVAARADRFLTYQVSTLLKPLVDLKSGDGLEGTAKGLGYRLAESYGLIQRREVAHEVRSLDQDARAALRKLGVRFGAYHIFVPALIKPAPAGLLTLLWAIANDGREKPGFGDVTQLLATGRTSVAPDPAFDPIFYPLAGYRVLGRRAVRVDILERLADLIRPALAWKPGTGRRPDGAYNGREFIVTPAMMSILGATAEDMDEILKGLGYRAQTVDNAEVQKLLAEQDAAAVAAESAKAAQTAEAAPASAAQGGGDAVATEAVTAGGAEDAAEPPTSAVAPDALDAAPAADAAPTSGDEADGLEPAVVPPTDPTAEPTETTAATAETPATVTTPPPAEAEPATSAVEAEPAEAPSAVSEPASEAVASAEPVPAEPVEAPEAKPVQLWRPQRFEGRGGARHGERGGQANRRFGGGRRGERAEGEGGVGQAHGERSERPDRQRRPRPERGGDGDERAPRFDKSAGKRGKGSGERGQGERPQGERNERPRFDKAPARPQRVDPDSPFAKLAALRDKLGK
ncbi:helicase-related protein [Aurantimonas sp. MSK8Z-1]|uniref:helicase-related protein n=1 Tax=Mangrovibrevibacter kandeliae TaxID=2968473 RepID=UPI002118BC3F|nr:helicase-related protein [Aurantimonas sp. MSK8Z-1]MCW4113415.1 helicase-related protein [Aurantimonas sp. MSK8Z-1]